MPSILIRNVPEDLMRKLRRLKIELNCNNWIDLLEILVRNRPIEEVSLSERELERMRSGVEGFLSLRRDVSDAWSDEPSVLEEIRRGRRHAKG